MENNTETLYIIYLHPKSNTHLYDKLFDYWNISKGVTTKEQNSALYYPFHITLCKFFKINEKKDLYNIIDTCKKEFSSLSKNPVETERIYYSPKFQTDIRSMNSKYSCGLKINSPEVSKCLDKIQSNCNDIKVKKSLHLTLYNNVSKNTMEVLQIRMPYLVHIEWEEINIILWETDENLSYWKQVSILK